MNKINLKEKLSLFDDYWNPRIAGELNGQYVKLVKFKGPFTWHHHETEDEMFLVVKGRFRMEFRQPSMTVGPLARDAGENPVAADAQSEVWLEACEVIVLPHGFVHRPVADA